MNCSSLACGRDGVGLVLDEIGEGVFKGKLQSSIQFARRYVVLASPALHLLNISSPTKKGGNRKRPTSWNLTMDRALRSLGPGTIFPCCDRVSSHDDAWLKVNFVLSTILTGGLAGDYISVSFDGHLRLPTVHCKAWGQIRLRLLQEGRRRIPGRGLDPFHTLWRAGARI